MQSGQPLPHLRYYASHSGRCETACGRTSLPVPRKQKCLRSCLQKPAPGLDRRCTLQECSNSQSFSVPYMPRKRSTQAALGNEFVANAMDGSEVNGMRHLRLKLLPQSQYVIVHRAGTRVVVITTHLIK